MYPSQIQYAIAASAETVDGYPRLRADGPALDSAARACDAVGRLFETDEAHPGVFALGNHLVDNGFTGWPGHCRILQPDLGYQLDCSASGCDAFLLFCPEAQPFFCFEPVTHPVNAHHLEGRPGLTLLSPGQSLEITWRMAVRPLGTG